MLRTELAPENSATASTGSSERQRRIEELAGLLMVANGEELRARATWAGSGPEARVALLERLRALLPAEVIQMPIEINQGIIFRCCYHLAVSSS